MVFSTLSFSLYKPKPSTVSQLRNNYVSALLSYEGAAYAPAEETDGTSCSTLVREALIDTVSFDKTERSVIQSHPCMSAELNKGCDGELLPILHANSLKSIDYNKTQLGDIAVIGNDVSIHTMAYIGNKTWIHADPIKEEVIESKEPDEDDDWLNYQVNIMRWNILADDQSETEDVRKK